MIEDTDYIIDRLVKEADSLPQQKNRFLQHLIELGYIPMFKVNALTPGDISQAGIRFFEDASATGP